MSRSGRAAKAEEYLKRAPNYSGEAITDLIAGATQIKRLYPVASALMVLFAKILEGSHKFSLPVGGRLFDGGIEPAMIESFRLPFSQVAFEFDAIQDEGPHDRFHVNIVPKRIALCVDVDHLAVTLGVAGIVSDARRYGNSCLVWPIDFKDGHWSASWCGAVIPYDQEAVRVTPDMVIGLREKRRAIGATEGLSNKPRKAIYGCSFVRLGDLGEAVAGTMGAYEAEYSANVDTLEEVTAAFQACAALACTNVTTEVIRPNREARAARPGSTLFDYHVLMIDPGRVREPGEDLGGTHAAPRTHLRRGHIRRHPSAGRIWVNSCVVNPTALGTVNKDYAIKSSAPGGSPERK